MDALRAFEVAAKSTVQGAKAGRAYVCAIRQAYRDALKPSGDLHSDYYAMSFGAMEEGGEALEPQPQCECWWVDEKLWTTHYGAAEPGSQMEWNPNCPAHPQTVPAGFGPCECVCRLCIQGEHCDTASCATLPDENPFDLPAAPTPEPRMECESIDAAEPVVGEFVFGYNEGLPLPNLCCGFGDACHCGCINPKVPSSSAGRGVGSPGVSAGAEEPAPPGKRTAVQTICDVLAGHDAYDYGSGVECAHPGGCTSPTRFPSWQDWREHVAPLIAAAAGVGVTPTPADVPEKFKTWFQ